MAARWILPIVLIGGVVGAVVFWKDICLPIGNALQTDLCSGGSPIDKIAQATQDAIKQFSGTGNPGQGALNSGTVSSAPNTPLAQDLKAVAAIPASVKPGISSFDGVAKAIGQANAQPNQSPTQKKCLPGAGLHFDSVFGFVDSCNKKVGYARANLGEISHFRMSIG